MIHGLSALPLTPVTESGIDLHAFVGMVERLAAAGVDSMGVLDSTPSHGAAQAPRSCCILACGSEVDLCHSIRITL